jgi:hypothetical protein
VAAARGTDDVVELGWRLGFGFEVKLVWGDMGEVHPSLYRLCVSFLVMPQSKSGLVETPHGRRPWSVFDLHRWRPW